MALSGTKYTFTFPSTRDAVFGDTIIILATKGTSRAFYTYVIGGWSRQSSSTGWESSITVEFTGDAIKATTTYTEPDTPTVKATYIPSFRTGTD